MVALCFSGLIFNDNNNWFHIDKFFKRQLTLGPASAAKTQLSELRIRVGGAPERIRTSGLLNRNQMLYPAELRVQLIVVVCIGGICK